MATKKPTYSDLSRMLVELRAQMPGALKIAAKDIGKADDRMMGSAVVITVTALGGHAIVQPFAITDGLSSETIEALRRDIDRSLKLLA